MGQIASSRGRLSLITLGEDNYGQRVNQRNETSN